MSIFKYHNILINFLLSQPAAPSSYLQCVWIDLLVSSTSHQQQPVHVKGEARHGLQQQVGVKDITTRQEGGTVDVEQRKAGPASSISSSSVNQAFVGLVPSNSKILILNKSFNYKAYNS